MGRPWRRGARASGEAGDGDIADPGETDMEGGDDRGERFMK
jgi:hypothetical protein